MSQSEMPPRPAKPGPGAFAFAILYTLHSFTQATTMTIIPLEALRLLGNARDVSVLFFVIAWAAFAARFVIPLLIRRFRRRRILSAGVLLVMTAPILIGTGGLAGLIAGSVLRGFGGACVNINLNLYIMDYVRKQDLVRVEPLKFGLSAVAWAGGPTLGVVLFERIDPWAAFLTASALAIAELMFFWYLRLIDDPAVAAMKAPPPNPRHFVRRFVAQPRLRLAWAIGFGRDFWWDLFLVYTPVYLVVAGTSNETAAYVVSGGMVTMVAAFAFGWGARRFGVRRVIVGGFIATGLATLAVLAVYDSWRFGAAALILGALAITACDSVANVAFFRAVRKRERPEMTMVYSTFGDLAGLVSMGAFAVLLSLFDLWIVFAATGLLMFGFAALARLLPRGL
ncbi:MAG: MFS transporter [Alphaproteobacteria bacterium]